MNLLNNAAQAIEAVPHPPIDVRAHRQNGWVTMELKDNGTGIPDSVKPRVFDPFFTTKDTAVLIGEEAVFPGGEGKETTAAPTASTPADVKILATDISVDVLNRATTGIYDEKRVGPISADLRQRYFTRVAREGADDYQVADSLRDLVVFRRLERHSHRAELVRMEMLPDGRYRFGLKFAPEQSSTQD